VNHQSTAAARASALLSFAFASLAISPAARAAPDITPPVLTGFESNASVDVTLATNPLEVRFKATDDMSGVRYGGAKAYGPSGQMVEVNFSREVPSIHASGVMLSYHLSGFLEPGTYVFKSAYVGDVNYNYTAYDEVALAALGRVKFTVKNEKGYDAVAPSLVGGKIKTPIVSVSAVQPGTDRGVYLYVSLTASDSGNTATAGVRDAVAEFCTANRANCIDVFSADDLGPRDAMAKLALGQEVRNLQVGVYELYQVRLGDFAGNRQVLTSQVFGGATDFSLYFPSTTITLTP
jgi:hypothetical protein